MESLEQTLRRLDQEREEADRRYNDALTALDRTVPRPGEWPSPHPIADDSQLRTINDAWDIAAVAPAGQSGWRGRLAGFIWRTVAPYLQRQASFNSRLVDHLNRNAAAARHAHQRGGRNDRARFGSEFARLAEFHALILHYLQQITALRRHAGSPCGRRRAGPQRVAERPGREHGQAMGVAERARPARRCPRDAPSPPGMTNCAR